MAGLEGGGFSREGAIFNNSATDTGREGKIDNGFFGEAGGFVEGGGIGVV